MQAIVFLGFAVASSAQQQGAPAPRVGSAEESYRKARAVLDAAIKAHTGGQPQPGVKSISVKLRGGQFHRHQSPKALGDPVSTPLAGELIADIERNWTVWERTGSFPGGIEFSNRWILRGNTGVNVDLLRKTEAQQANPAAFAELQLRRIPSVLLAQALTRAATLRWLGEFEATGKKLNAISYATATGATLSLYFDAESQLLNRWEAMQSDPLRGDVLSETVLKGYQQVSGIPLPTGQITRLGGVLTQDFDYSEWAVNETLPASAFEVPSGLRPAVVSASAAPSAGAAGTQEPSVNELGGGLFSIEGLPGYRVLFQEFRDFVMIFEAPQNDDFSLRVLGMVRARIPNKPVRYAAVTHHHDDHAGGFRTYVAQRVAVITTPKNIPFFLASFGGRYTIAPDTMARNPHREVSHHIDAVQDGRDTITNGEATVELIDIGPSPHAEEMLVFWFPAQKILFQGDLWNREADAVTRPANDTTLHFAEWLQRSGLPVERIMGVHGPSGTPAGLQQAVRLRADGRK